MGNDRSWMYLPRAFQDFENGVIKFLNASFAKAARGNQIRCPCRQCKNRYWYRRNEVFDHLKVEGFVENYEVWTFHGEEMNSIDVFDDDCSVMHDNVDELLNDRFRDTIEGGSNFDGPNKEAESFYKLVEEGKEALFPGCKTFSKLSFVIRMLQFLLQKKEVIPEANIPTNFYGAKKLIKDLGLEYKKIPACPNDCMLYWKEYENAEECHVCHTSKWKQNLEEVQPNGTGKPVKSKSKIPAKVLWHFPLKPRLQRLFMCSETAKSMTWHADERLDDGILRHPADGSAWKDFDSLYPSCLLM